MVNLGASADGRTLEYDADLYEFWLSNQPVSYDDVRALDARDWIRWCDPRLREWFVKIERDALAACHRRAVQAAGAAGVAGAVQAGAPSSVALASMADSGASAERPARASEALDVISAAQPRLLYRSLNPAVAKVDRLGNVVVRGSGMAEIIAAGIDDPGFTSAVRLVTISCEVS